MEKISRRLLNWASILEPATREQTVTTDAAPVRQAIEAAFEEWVGVEVQRQEGINCHPSYTEQEKHFSDQVWLSRKGAISARHGEPGLIPGLMGTASYVVEGKGNPVALFSSPHGAGRAYSRSAARKMFTREQLREAMAGIEYRDADAFIDEIPMAYQNIDQVMIEAADLVEVRHTAHQIVNVQGD